MGRAGIRTPIRVGLTGGIGSGKTTVSQMFGELGVPVIDADEISRTVTKPGGAAYAAVAQLGGAGALAPDGTLRRDELRRRAFQDPGFLKRLEDIIHPLVQEEISRLAAAADHPYCIISIPLLVEKGADATLDRVLVVDLPEELQLERAASRDRSDKTAIADIMAQQASRAERLRAADDVIRNDGDLASLRMQVQQLHRQYLAAAGVSIAARS